MGVVIVKQRVSEPQDKVCMALCKNCNDLTRECGLIWWNIMAFLNKCHIQCIFTDLPNTCVSDFEWYNSAFSFHILSTLIHNNLIYYGVIWNGIISNGQSTCQTWYLVIQVSFIRPTFSPSLHSSLSSVGFETDEGRKASLESRPSEWKIGTTFWQIPFYNINHTVSNT